MTGDGIRECRLKRRRARTSSNYWKRIRPGLGEIRKRRPDSGSRFRPRAASGDAEEVDQEVAGGSTVVFAQVTEAEHVDSFNEGSGERHKLAAPSARQGGPIRDPIWIRTSTDYR